MFTPGSKRFEVNYASPKWPNSSLRIYLPLSFFHYFDGKTLSGDISKKNISFDW
jgi:hypothetical protein